MDWLQYSCKYNVHIIDFFLFSFFNKGCYKSCLKKSRMRFQWILLVPLHCAHSLAPSIDAGQILAFNSWPSVHPMSKSWNDIGCTKGQLLKRRIWPASKHQGDWQMQWNELIKRALSTKTILRYGIFQRDFFCDQGQGLSFSSRMMIFGPKQFVWPRHVPVKLVK